MRKLLLVATVAAISLSTAAFADPLFTIGGNFTVTGSNSPGPVNATVPLTVGNHNLGSGLNLNINIVPDASTPGSEWLVFTYAQLDGPLFGNPSGNWDLNEVGLPAAVAVNFIGAAVQWYQGGTVLSQTGSTGVFGQSLGPSPVPGEVGQAEQSTGFVAPFPAGALPTLGSFINPLTQLSAHGINTALVTAYSEALQFVAQDQPPPVGVPEPATLAVLGMSLLGLTAVRRRRG